MTSLPPVAGCSGVQQSAAKARHMVEIVSALKFDPIAGPGRVF